MHNREFYASVPSPGAGTSSGVGSLLLVGKELPVVLLNPSSDAVTAVVTTTTFIITSDLSCYALPIVCCLIPIKRGAVVPREGEAKGTEGKVERAYKARVRSDLGTMSWEVRQKKGPVAKSG